MNLYQLGRDVQGERKRRGWTVAETAARLDRSESWLEKLESGHLRLVGGGELFLLGVVLGVPRESPGARLRAFVERMAALDPGTDAQDATIIVGMGALNLRTAADHG